MQRSLLEPDLPTGFEYSPEFISPADERELLQHLALVAFSNVEMHGVVARRRTAHYGWTYGYEARTSAPGIPLPPFLLPVRERAAAWLGVQPDELAEALLTEYPPGAPIGWHRDAPMFGDIAGISLGAACRMKFRPYVSPSRVRADESAAGTRLPRRASHEVVLASRSAYLISGIARKGFEHSIPPVEGMRYSITFRTLAGKQGRQA